MKRLNILIYIVFLGLMPAVAQVRFFEGPFDQALQKAQTEQKKVFVDFYTVWCGPCKLMSEKVFPDVAVGAYFNEKFISCQINAEDKAFAEWVRKYQVKAYPTLLILDASGNVLGRQEGALEPALLLKFAQRTNGELLGFEEMYERLKTHESDESLIQALLLEAPDFLGTLPEGPTYDRWLLRMERLFADYRKKKTLEKMMNPTDFAILMTWHDEADKQDEVLDYIMGHYDKVVGAVGQDAVYKYVFTLNTGLMQRLAEKGDLAYQKPLERLKGDMKPLYDALMNFNGQDAYTGMKTLYDAKYYLYGKKDVVRFIELMDRYFDMLGQTVTPADYRAAVDDFSEVLGRKFSPQVSAKCIDWVSKALQGDIATPDRMEMLLMLGDCHKMQKDMANARQCYKQAYVVSLQFNNPGLSERVRQYGAELENE